jgi:two-component system sensor histidine kinase/response regulator
MKLFEPSDFRILLVDDVPKNLQILGKTLQKESYKVEFAMNGKKALEWLKSDPNFDLILLDIMMPEMDGLETCKAIRKNKDFDAIPVVFLTARSEKEVVLEGFELGAQDYITKPFDSRELLARVRTQLELKNSRDFLSEMNEVLEEMVQKRTEALIQSNKKLQNAYDELATLDEAKTEFLRIISHEVRTPLNGIMGPLQLLKYKVGDENRKMFDILDTSISRLDDLAMNALMITRLMTDSDDLNLSEVRNSELLENILEKRNTDLLKKDIRIKFEGESCQMKLDQELMSVCFDHIFDNAIRFAPEGTDITIEERTTDGFYYLIIKDKGKGFAEKATKHLFKLYAPGEPHVDGNEGLGLALSKLIVNAHHGNITAGNNPDGGAYVEIELPLSNNNK